MFVISVFGLEKSRRVFDGLYHCLKFRWNRCSSFNNVQVLIFNEFGLKCISTAPKLRFWGLYPVNGEQPYRDSKKVSACVRKHVIRRIDRFRAAHPFIQPLKFYAFRSSGSIYTPSNTWFPGSTRFSIPNGILIGSAVFAQLTTGGPYTLQWAAPLPSKLPVRIRGSGPPSNTWFLESTRAHNPKRHFDRFSRFLQGLQLTDRPTDQQTDRSITTLLGR